MMIIDDINKKELYENTTLRFKVCVPELVKFGSMKGMPCTLVAETNEHSSVLSLVEQITTKMIFIQHDNSTIDHDAFDVFVDLCHQNNIFVVLMTRSLETIPNADWTIMVLDYTNEYKVNYDNFDKIGEFIVLVNDNFDIKDLPPSVLAMPCGAVWLMAKHPDLVDYATMLVYEHQLRLLEVDYV